MKPRVEVSFNLSFFRRFWLLLKIMFPRVLSCTALLAILVLLLGGLDQVLTYNVGVMPSEFYQVLGGRDDNGFKTTLAKSFGLVLGKAVVSYIFYPFQGRQSVSSCSLKLCFPLKIQNYFSDQRIAQDVERTCNVFSQIFSKVVMSPFIIAYYTYKTWQSSGYLGPLSIYSYFIISTIINKFAMSPVVRCVANQEKKEGDFRFKHMAVRSHSEAIAFYHSDSLEKLFTEQRLENLLNAQQKLVNWRFLLNGVTNFVDYFGSILSYMIISIPILVEGKYDNVGPVEISALISRNSFYYLYLINSFSTLIDLNSKVSDMAGTAHRHDEDNKADSGSVTEDLCSVYKNFAGMCLISLESVSLYLPESNTCLPSYTLDLTIDIVQGRHLLITGNSSCGKTSFLRMLCGFWKAQEGSNDIDDACIYLSDELIACFFVAIVDDQNLISLLKSVNLTHLVERCGGLDAEIFWDWNDVLTPGEAQRLSVLRALYHRPLLTFLDEATSAMGTDYETSIYKHLLSNGTTIVSVGHRHSIRQFHDVELHFTGDGHYSVAELSASKIRL
ncbi:ABC protein, subfamily ABCD [Trichuris trichiura]|uniref:ABC protein, subfamily ABCD n=1 Tax=Trichuris trichiura TaxID=36087 RepID=A0A077ZB97_TRITR|nr:ABC protein, subfamily ABCD [Trichuris trichiura]